MIGRVHIFQIYIFMLDIKSIPYNDSLPHWNDSIILDIHRFFFANRNSASLSPKNNSPVIIYNFFVIDSTHYEIYPIIHSSKHPKFNIV